VTAPAPISARLGAVQLLVMDVDGVLTDGGIYYTERGDELKRFDVRDGQGLVLLRQAGVLTAVITRRRSEIVERRADELGIVEVHQGATDNRAVL
jgi:YrbI family 3-deoxy-D-manno-octulosonate 8-phosphate phosphatase